MQTAGQAGDPGRVLPPRAHRVVDEVVGSLGTQLADQCGQAAFGDREQRGRGPEQAARGARDVEAMQVPVGTEDGPSRLDARPELLDRAVDDPLAPCDELLHEGKGRVGMAMHGQAEEDRLRHGTLRSRRHPLPAGRHGDVCIAPGVCHRSEAFA